MCAPIEILVDNLELIGTNVNILLDVHISQDTSKWTEIKSCCTKFDNEVLLPTICGQADRPLGDLQTPNFNYVIFNYVFSQTPDFTILRPRSRIATPTPVPNT